MTSDNFKYIGSELELFAEAKNWKAYLADQIRPYLGQDVLEIGAGIGATCQMLCTPAQRSWTALEPDATLAAKARARATGDVCTSYDVRTAMSDNLGSDEFFDSVIYIDVLEHVPEDTRELQRSTAHLRANGYLVVLSPAHQWLFSPFDAAIGHLRRYTRHSLSTAVPGRLRLVRLRYLDCFGMAASLANRLLLKQSLPTNPQIVLWDRWIVPVSRNVDPLLRFTVGKSILGIWRA